MDDLTSEPGRMKKTPKNSSSGASLVMGKYTYYRKRLPQKELGSFQRLADKFGLGNKQVDKLKKHVSGDLDVSKEVETAAFKPEMTKQNKRKKEKSANGKSFAVIAKSNLHGKQSSLKNAASQKVLKLSQTVRGMLLFCFYGCSIYYCKFVQE